MEGNLGRRVENVSQEITQQSSCVRALFRKELSCHSGVFTELTLRLEHSYFLPCSVCVDEVDEVDVGGTDSLRSIASWRVSDPKVEEE